MPQHTSLFVSALHSDPLVAEAKATDHLETTLARLTQTGHEAWPDLPLAPGVFIEALAHQLNASPPRRGLEQWLEHVQPADFHLAQACRLGLPGAIETFERTYKTDIDRLLHRYKGPTLPPDDLLQQLREKLFVSTPERAGRISSYSGQGFLQNWLRVTGTRMFIDMLRSSSRRQEREQLTDDGHFMNIMDELHDLELDFLKREYRGQFKTAFAAAAQSLTSHERNLLRQHLVFHLTMEQLGKLYSIHPSSASRRIAKARETLLENTRAEFMKHLKLEHEEFESIMNLIRSRLDLSITRLLKTQPS